MTLYSEFIIFDEISGRSGNIGTITLNRPKALNALNQNMILALDQQLSQWNEANHIKAIIIRANESRAFCAGGDVRDVYQRKQAGDSDLIHFFRDEYRLNSRIHHFNKPYIALLNGMTMGGGAGISIHGSHRVATKNLIFSMPETGIGFYPDIGATYFLSRLPYKIGFYLGLTGARISYQDCFDVGLIDYCVEEEKFPEIIYALSDAAFTGDSKAIVSEVLQEFSVETQQSNLLVQKEKIMECFAKPTVEEILKALTADGSDWCLETATVIKTKSPTSLKVTLQALQRATELEFDECMEIEYRLTNHFLHGHDFFEGVRAVVIDKDQKPHWQPAHLKDVSPEKVEEYFSALEKELFE